MTPAIQALLELAKEQANIKEMERINGVFEEKEHREVYSKTEIALKRAEPDLLVLIDKHKALLALHEGSARESIESHKAYASLMDECDKLKAENAELLKDRERLEAFKKVVREVARLLRKHIYAINERENKASTRILNLMLDITSACDTVSL